MQQQSKLRIDMLLQIGRNTDSARPDGGICSEFCDENQHQLAYAHVHIHTTWVGSSEQASLAPARANMANTVVLARAPPGPSSGLADARCRLRSGLCPHPITPSESRKVAECLAEENGKSANVQTAVHRPACVLLQFLLQFAACSLQPAPHCQSVKEATVTCGPAPGCISQIIL